MSDRRRDSPTIPCRDSASSPAQSVPPAAVLPLFERVEELPEGATGALLFGSETAPAGAILVEAGRICWAAVDSMRRRLTDLLRKNSDPPIPAEVLQAAFRKCRDTRRPFGETLVAEGIVSEDGLRRTLRQHSAESIAVLTLLGNLPVVFRASKERRYDARFTFSPAELLCTIGALREPSMAASARVRLRELLSQGGLGVAFHRSSTTALPVPIGVVGADDLSVMEIVEAGQWSVGAQDVSAAIGAKARVYAAGSSSGRFATTWLEGDVVYTVFCESTAVLARVLAKRSTSLSS
ncbi:MAG: hypothetical protein KC766_22005 [Myxococcales bacterium]|nr:hypothetical protein [Myxococcales bacterium]